MWNKYFRGSVGSSVHCFAAERERGIDVGTLLYLYTYLSIDPLVLIMSNDKDKCIVFITQGDSNNGIIRGERDSNKALFRPT